MTLTLSPELERALDETARQRGTTPEQAAMEILRTGLLLSRSEAARASADEKERRRQEALARVRSGYYAGTLSSSEDFSARKNEEKALEERRWRA